MTTSTLLLLFLVKVNHPHYQSITKIWSSQSHLVNATQCLKMIFKSHTTTKVIFWRENSNSPNRKIRFLFCFQRWASFCKNQLLNGANFGKNGAKIKIFLKQKNETYLVLFKHCDYKTRLVASKRFRK